MILSLVLGATLSSTPAAATTVARVDAVAITQAEVVRAYGELRAQNARSRVEDALDTLVLDVLFAAEARRTGLADEPRVRELVERERRKVAAAAMIEREVAAAPPPSEAELRKRYHSTADSARLRALVFPSEDAARVALELAKRSGKLDDASRAPIRGFEMPGGSGPKIRAQLSPALAEVAFDAPIGVPTGPVQLETGWALVSVVERRIGDEAGFQSQRASLVQSGKTQAAEAMKVHAREKLRGRARITTDDAFNASLGRRADATPAELDHAMATVNGRPIPYRDIEPSVRQVSQSSGHAAGPEVRAQVLEREIDERLLQDAAAERGLLSDPEIAPLLPAVERRTLAIAYLDRMAAGAAAPSEKEIRAFYEKKVAPTGQDLESSRGAIVSHLREEKRLVLLQAKASELKSHAHIVIDRDALAATARG